MLPGLFVPNSQERGVPGVLTSIPRDIFMSYIFRRVNMKNLLALVMLLFLIAPAFAAGGEVPLFSDRDLEKYQSGDHDTSASPAPKEEEKKGKEEQPPARYEVPYGPMRGGGRKIIIPVTINNSLTVPMLLDTGSTGMYISSGLAEKLGVFKKDEGRLSASVMGAGGRTPVILTIVDTVQVGEAKDEFIPTMVEVRKPRDDSMPGRAAGTVFKGFEGVIGMDFMSKFAIRIDTGRHVIVLVEHLPGPDMPGGHTEEWWRSTFHMFASIRSDWKKYRDSLYKVKDETVIMKELRSRADQQYKEADRLMTKLNNYAVDHIVPMEWRQY